MILSFPIDAWLLLIVAVGLGLGLEVVFYRGQRARPRGSAPVSGGPSEGGDGRQGGDGSGDVEGGEARG